MRKTFTVKAASLALGVCGVVALLSVFVGYRTLFRLQKQDGMELTQAAAVSATASVEGVLKWKVEQVQAFSKIVYENLGRRKELTVDQVFQIFGGELQDEVLGLSFYFPQGNGKYNPKYFANHFLQKKCNLPDGFLAQLEQVSPIDLAALAQRDSAWLGNRSVAVEGGEPQPVLSLGFTATLPDGKKPKILIVADLHAEFLQNFLRSTETFDLSMVTGSGRIFAHPNSLLMATYSQKAWLQRPEGDALQQNQVVREGKTQTLLTWNRTKLDDIFVVARHHETSARAAASWLILRLGALWLLAACAVVGGIIAFSRTWREHLREYAKAANLLGTDRPIQLKNAKGPDELVDLHNAIEAAEKRMAQRANDAYERGFADSDARLAQMYRTCLTPLPSGEFPSGIEVLSIQPDQREWRADFCDFHANEGSLTVVLGRATISGAAGSLVGALMKSTFESLRALTDSRKQLNLGPMLAAANRVIYRVFEGKVQVKVTGLQLDLKTGEFFLTNAGHGAPLYAGAGSTGNMNQAVVEGAEQKLFALQTPPLGLKGEVDFSPGAFRLTQGRTLVLFTTNRQEAQSTEAHAATERQLRAFVDAQRDCGPAEWMSKYQAAQPQIDPRNELVLVMIRWREKVDRLKPFNFNATTQRAA